MTLIAVGRYSAWEAVVVACLLSAGTGYLAFNIWSWQVALVFPVLAGWFAYQQMRHDQTANLVATNLEFHPSQRKWMVGLKRSVPRADIADLEYRSQRGGGDAGAEPGGIYATLNPA